MDLTKLFTDEGADEEAQVPVDVSYDIIRHVSAQLYTSPRKAIEELVCNAYDAGATVATGDIVEIFGCSVGWAAPGAP